MAMPKPVRPIRPRLEATASPRKLGDDLLEEILVRVASPADLARFSAASVSFHRVITDPVFLRRYRSLHPPLVLGVVNKDDGTFEPAEAPHPGAPAGRATARAADFSFDYVPQPARGGWGSWRLRETYSGRVLLVWNSGQMFVSPPDLAVCVCDPLSRRYLLLPPIPDGQANGRHLTLKDYDVLFAPSVVEEDDDETSFRVIMVIHCRQELVVTVFSSGSSTSSGSWNVCASASWDTLMLEFSRQLRGRPCYAHNCLYWKVLSESKLVKLNMNTKEFSTVDLVPGHEKRVVLIVEEGNGMFGMFSPQKLCTSLPANYYTSVQKEGKIANKWQLKDMVPMPSNIGSSLYSVCEPQRYIFLQEQSTLRCFTLDFKTMTFERVVNTTKCQDVQPYLGYPPFMSPRRI